MDEVIVVFVVVCLCLVGSKEGASAGGAVVSAVFKNAILIRVKLRIGYGLESCVKCLLKCGQKVAWRCWPYD